MVDNFITGIEDKIKEISVSLEKFKERPDQKGYFVPDLYFKIRYLAFMLERQVNELRARQDLEEVTRSNKRFTPQQLDTLALLANKSSFIKDGVIYVDFKTPTKNVLDLSTVEALEYHSYIFGGEYKYLTPKGLMAFRLHHKGTVDFTEFVG
jgi:hypothetical protein